MIEIATYQTRLEHRLKELETRLLGVESALDEPVNADFEERATEREGDEVLEDLGNSGLQEIAKIKAALRRIADGSFGTCVACGEPISEERLNAVPHAARCKRCAT